MVSSQCVLIEDLSRVSRDQADVATIYKRLALPWDRTGSRSLKVSINELHIGLKGHD